MLSYKFFPAKVVYENETLIQQLLLMHKEVKELPGSTARSTYVSYSAILAKYKWSLLHLRLISLSFSRRVTKNINFENGKTLAESILLR